MIVQIKYISELNLTISLNFWFRELRSDFSSPLPVLGICYLEHRRCQYILQNNGVRTGGIEARMQWTEGCEKEKLGTGKEAKQFGSLGYKRKW